MEKISFLVKTLTYQKKASAKEAREIIRKSLVTTTQKNVPQDESNEIIRKLLVPSSTASVDNDDYRLYSNLELGSDIVVKTVLITGFLMNTLTIANLFDMSVEKFRLQKQIDINVIYSKFLSKYRAYKKIDAHILLAKAEQPNIVAILKEKKCHVSFLWVPEKIEQDCSLYGMSPTSSTMYDNLGSYMQTYTVASQPLSVQAFDEDVRFFFFCEKT